MLQRSCDQFTLSENDSMCLTRFNAAANRRCSYLQWNPASRLWRSLGRDPGSGVGLQTQTWTEPRLEPRKIKPKFWEMKCQSAENPADKSVSPATRSSSRLNKSAATLKGGRRGFSSDLSGFFAWPPHYRTDVASGFFWGGVATLGSGRAEATHNNV